MCIPVDSMLWALVARIQDEGYLATAGDLRALLGSGCPRARVRAVLDQARAARPDRPFEAAIAVLDGVEVGSQRRG